MNICAVCCTYLRPQCLGAAIDCFTRQTHAARKLVILDDAGQYAPQAGDRWELHSTATRYPSLGAKRNACAAIALADPSIEALAIMDDDDWYFPHWLESIVAALEQKPWCIPDIVYSQRHPDRLTLFRCGWRHGGGLHPATGYRRDLFVAAGGYPDGLSRGEDTGFVAKCHRIAGDPADSSPAAERSPYVLIRPWCGQPNYSMGAMDPDTGYASLAAASPAAPVRLVVASSEDYTQWPVAQEIVDWKT